SCPQTCTPTPPPPPAPATPLATFVAPSPPRSSLSSRFASHPNLSSRSRKAGRDFLFRAAFWRLGPFFILSSRPEQRRILPLRSGGIAAPTVRYKHFFHSFTLFSSLLPLCSLCPLW